MDNKIELGLCLGLFIALAFWSFVSGVQHQSEIEYFKTHHCVEVKNDNPND